MKVTIKNFNAVAHWRWNLSNTHSVSTDQSSNEEQESEEEDLCGICRVAFEGCCPDCRIPGDDCPLSLSYSLSYLLLLV